MHTHITAGLLGISVFLAGTIPAEAKHLKVAIPDMQVTGADKGLGKILSEILTTELSRFEEVTVIGSSDIQALIGFEKEKDLLGCSDNVSCMADIGGALGVDQLLISDLGLVGTTYVINLKLIDTQAVKVINRVYKTVSGPPDALIKMVTDCLPQLMGLPTKPGVAPATIASPPIKPTPEGTATITIPAPTSAPQGQQAQMGQMGEPFSAPQPAFTDGRKPTAPGTTARAEATPSAAPAPETTKATPPPTEAAPGASKQQAVPSAKRSVGGPATFMAIGGLALVSGVTMLAIAKADNDRASTTMLGTQEWSGAGSMEWVELARTLSIAGIAATAGGAALFTGGLIWLLVKPGKKPVATAAAYSIVPTFAERSAGLVFSGAW